MRRFRQLSLGVHPDKNLEDERAQGAFGRLQTAKDDIIRGHEVEQADDGSTVIKPLALNNYGDERMGECFEVLDVINGDCGIRVLILAVGSSLLAVGCGLQIVGCRLCVVDCGLWVVDCGLWAVGCGLCVVGCGLLAVGCGL